MMRTTTSRTPCSTAAVFYPPSILEEELKNRVAADWFGAFDCSRILGKVYWHNDGLFRTDIG